jgi:hypothetical protein
MSLAFGDGAAFGVIFAFCFLLFFFFFFCFFFFFFCFFSSAGSNPLTPLGDTHSAHALLDVAVADDNVAGSIHGSSQADFTAWQQNLFTVLAQATCVFWLPFFFLVRPCPHFCVLVPADLLLCRPPVTTPPPSPEASMTMMTMTMRAKNFSTSKISAGKQTKARRAPKQPRSAFFCGFVAKCLY